MSDEDDIHPVVRLLAKRMESHPQEFGVLGNGRWSSFMNELEPALTEKERLLMRKPFMDRIHEEVMDELLNGEQRRAEDRRKMEENQRLHAQKMQAQLQQLNSALQSQQNALPTWADSIPVGSSGSLFNQIKGKLGL